MTFQIPNGENNGARCCCHLVAIIFTVNNCSILSIITAATTTDPQTFPSHYPKLRSRGRLNPWATEINILTDIHTWWTKSLKSKNIIWHGSTNVLDLQTQMIQCSYDTFVVYSPFTIFIFLLLIINLINKCANWGDPGLQRVQKMVHRLTKSRFGLEVCPYYIHTITTNTVQ